MRFIRATAPFSIGIEKSSPKKGTVMIKLSANTAAAPANKFLNVFFQHNQSSILSALEFVELEDGRVLHEPYEHYQYIYFPESGIVSLVSTFEDGSTVEAGIVGRDGFVGLAAVLSQGVSPRQSVVQMPGAGYRVKTEVFKRAFEEDSRLRAMTLEYVYSFYSQVSQNGACNKCHMLGMRLAKWLLMVHDRADSDVLSLKHDFIAQMLGAQRPTVSVALKALQCKGLIRQGRGAIKVLDRPGLEAEACECYAMLNGQYLD
jgi:CRP-like cAMP-binding protein